jgi:hypothetical protein
MTSPNDALSLELTFLVKGHRPYGDGLSGTRTAVKRVGGWNLK